MGGESGELRRLHGLGRPVHGISTAAELVDSAVRTLRLYERHGLLTPARTEGGTRRYSDADLYRLRRIIALTTTGVNLAGVARLPGSCVLRRGAAVETEVRRGGSVGMAELYERIRSGTSRSYEVLGRVVSVLCRTSGPLVDCPGFHTWPFLDGDGHVLAWRGPRPTAHEVLDYLGQAAADDEMTTVLRPGDVRWCQVDDRLVVDVRGVQFQLRPEPPTVRTKALTAAEQPWSGHGAVSSGREFQFEMR